MAFLNHIEQKIRVETGNNELQMMIDKFTFTWGKDMKKCFHHTLKVANDAKGQEMVMYLKASPSEVVIGGFQTLGAGGRLRENFGHKFSIIKVSIQNFQLGAAREKGNF
ncbi:hypothetical protein L195_g048266 [Trifolium pratense]|uniref:Uncharacterized protein n=1 Tax=Trifolium pratense TaxID=57577 RepID=A0A2K3JKS3_TRIPR|nr:hypothetical protein L195_g048266 [Trifolium pratense]